MRYCYIGGLQNAKGDGSPRVSIGLKVPWNLLPQFNFKGKYVQISEQTSDLSSKVVGVVFKFVKKI